MIDAHQAAAPWPLVWRRVADELREQFDQGLSLLVTKDVVRHLAVRALLAEGIASERLRVESTDLALAGTRLDLVVDRGEPHVHAVEVVVPMEPREAPPIDVATLGRLLAAPLRAVSVPARRHVVAMVLHARLLRYLDGRSELLGTTWPRAGQALTISPALLKALPAGARTEIRHGVRRTAAMRCVEQLDLGHGRTLLVYEVSEVAAEPQAPQANVDASQADVRVEPAALPATSTTSGPPVSRALPSARDVGPSARLEILAVVDTLSGSSGELDVGVEEVVIEMRRRRSRYAESTVRTMVSSHMADGPHADLERVARGRYRRRAEERSGATPDSGKASDVRPRNQVQVVVPPDSGPRARVPIERSTTLIPDEALVRSLRAQLASGSRWGMDEQTWTTLLVELADRMESLARHRTAQIYSELVAGTVLDGRRDWHLVVSPALAVIGRCCNSMNLPLLTAVVFGKARNTPGPGFNDLAKSLRRQRLGEEDLDFWLRELRRVHDTWSSAVR